MGDLAEWREVKGLEEESEIVVLKKQIFEKIN